jgi:hypothetical protein
LSGEACEAGLAINGRKDMKGKLLRLFYDYVLSGRIPPNHMMVLWTFKETVQRGLSKGSDGNRRNGGCEWSHEE